MRFVRFIGVLGLAALVASGAQAQRAASSAGLAGANPPPKSLPAPRSAAKAASPATAASAAAASTTAANAAQAQGSGGDVSTDKTYILGAADVVEVSVLGRNEYTTRSRISEAGTMQLQYLGEVHVAGKTAAQFSGEVATALEKGRVFRQSRGARGRRLLRQPLRDGAG